MARISGFSEQAWEAESGWVALKPQQPGKHLTAPALGSTVSRGPRGLAGELRRARDWDASNISFCLG